MCVFRFVFLVVHLPSWIRFSSSLVQLRHRVYLPRPPWVMLPFLPTQLMGERCDVFSERSQRAALLCLHVPWSWLLRGWLRLTIRLISAWTAYNQGVPYPFEPLSRSSKEFLRRHLFKGLDTPLVRAVQAKWPLTEDCPLDSIRASSLSGPTSSTSRTLTA